MRDYLVFFIGGPLDKQPRRIDVLLSEFLAVKMEANDGLSSMTTSTVKYYLETLAGDPPFYIYRYEELTNQNCLERLFSSYFDQYYERPSNHNRR